MTTNETTRASAPEHCRDCGWTRMERCPLPPHRCDRWHCSRCGHAQLHDDEEGGVPRHCGEGAEP